MTIKIGDQLPEGTLAEFVETETAGCSLGPNTFQVADLVKGKKIVGSSRVDLQACKLEYSIVSPK